MVGLIITGHGTLAGSMYETCIQTIGAMNHMIAVDGNGRTLEEMKEALRKAAETLKDSCEGILVLTDLMNGVPCKAAMALAEESAGKIRIEVLSGMNLGMVMETAQSRMLIRDLDSLSDIAAESAKRHVVWCTSQDANTAPVRNEE